MRHSSFRSPLRLALGLLAATAGLLDGCSLVPPYQRPVPLVPTTLGSATAASPDQPSRESPGLTQLERSYLVTYGFQGLEPLLVRALSHNHDYRLAVLQVAQARAQYGIERAAELPELDASTQLTRQQFGDPELQARYQQHVAAAGIGGVDYELDFFGRLRAMSQAARERYLASVEGQQALRGAVLAETLRACVRMHAAVIAAAQWEAMDRGQAAVAALADRQFALGVLSGDDRQARWHAAEQVHTKTLLAQDERRSAVRALQILVGYDAPLASVAWTVPEDAPMAWRNLSSSVLLDRPDVRQAEAELRAAYADIGAARAAFFPSIQLTTAVGTASDSLNRLFDGRRVWQFMPQINLPLFDAGSRRANLTLAEARKDAAIVAYEKTIAQAFRDVADALDASTTTGEAERRERAEVERVRQRVDRLNRRASQGLEDQATVLAGAIEAAQAELAYVQAMREAAIGQIALFQALYGVRLPTASAGPPAR